MFLFLLCSEGMKPILFGYSYRINKSHDLADKKSRTVYIAVDVLMTSVDQLPQHTMMFSPQIVSTQNIATLARTSSSPSKSQPHVEQDNLSDEEVATPEQVS